MTIEPTAIRAGLPVNIEFGSYDIDKLYQALIGKKYHNALIYVAWEHKGIVRLVRLFVKKFNLDMTIPNWSNTDFNRYYQIVINWNVTKANPKPSLSIVTKELPFKNGFSSQCPS